jgi:hypothetical protein
MIRQVIKGLGPELLQTNLPVNEGDLRILRLRYAGGQDGDGTGDLLGAGAGAHLRRQGERVGGPGRLLALGEDVVAEDDQAARHRRHARHLRSLA